MDRNKLLAFSAAAVAALAVASIGLGGAQAATWHDYKGDVFAGHAYGLQVPAKAKSYEVVLTGGPNASAKVALFDPSGARLAYHELSPAMGAASVGSPAPGRHVLYVYDVVDGALAVRVNADDAPALDLQEIPLAREDVSLGEQDAPAKLDKTITTKLGATPVFLTLLYQGSARDLSATVASAKGDVVTITGESGTAFAPGVFNAQTGARASQPSNIDGVAYTAKIQAESFQGELFLTALSLDLRAPAAPMAKQAPVPAPPARPEHAPARAPAAPLGAATIELEEGAATAFVVDAGKLTLASPREDEGEGDAGATDAVSVYGPDDALVAYVELSGDEPAATIDLATPGEYVAFVHQARSGKIVAQVVGGPSALVARELVLVEDEIAISVSSGGEASTLTLPHVPVALRLAVDDAVGALGSARLLNEEGVVAEAQSLAAAPGAGFLSWSQQFPERFAKGEHALRVDGVLEGELRLVVVRFVRDATAEAPAPAVENEDEEAPASGPLGLPLPRIPGVPL